MKDSVAKKRVLEDMISLAKVHFCQVPLMKAQLKISGLKWERHQLADVEKGRPRSWRVVEAYKNEAGEQYHEHAPDMMFDGSV